MSYFSLSQTPQLEDKPSQDHIAFNSTFLSVVRTQRDMVLEGRASRSSTFQASQWFVQESQSVTNYAGSTVSSTINNRNGEFGSFTHYLLCFSLLYLCSLVSICSWVSVFVFVYACLSVCLTMSFWFGKGLRCHDL